MSEKDKTWIDEICRKVYSLIYGRMYSFEIRHREAEISDNNYNHYQKEQWCPTVYLPYNSVKNFLYQFFFFFVMYQGKFWEYSLFGPDATSLQRQKQLVMKK